MSSTPTTRLAAVDTALERLEAAKNAEDRKSALEDARSALAELEDSIDETLTTFDLEVADTPDAKLTAALTRAQAAFPVITKGKTATVPTKNGNSYTYSYADLADVLSACRPVLAAHGIAAVQSTREENGKVILTTTLRHVAGGELESHVELGTSSSNPQQFGGALTYLRRYELTTLLGVAAEEDLDAQQVDPPARGNGNGGGLPPWAREASDNRKRELVNALEPYVGPDNARTVGKKVAETTGAGVPEVAVTTAKVIGLALMAWQKTATATAQDRAAEQPPAEPEHDDGPPLEPEQPAPAGPPPVDQPLTAWPYDRVKELAENTAARDEHREAAYAELERRQAARDSVTPHPAEDKTAVLAAGTVPMPELPTDPAVAWGVLKAAGCVCRDPFGIRSEKPDTNDACPINGHGIPF